MRASARPDSIGLSRATLIECAIVAVVVFAAYAISRPDAFATLGRLYDDVVYLSVGRSIAQGHGYRSAQLVGTPGHAKFPPLLPALYALGWYALGSLHRVATFALWANIVVTAFSAALVWWLARCELGIGRVLTALFVIVPILTDRTMFYFSGAASEPWMLLGWTASLLLVRRLTRLPAAGRRVTIEAIALGLTLAATALSRSQGIVIVGAVLTGAALVGLGWRTWLVSSVSAIVPLVAWSVYHGAIMARGPLLALPDQSSYVAWVPTSSVRQFVAFVVAMTRISVPLYWSNTADVLVGWTSPKTLLLATALLVSGLVGLVMVARKFPALAISLALTLAVLAIWPYVQDRFLTPVLPVLGLAGAFAAQGAADRLPIGVRRGALGVAALVGAMLLIENGRLRASSSRGPSSSPFAQAMDAIVDWIDHNTAPNDHIMASWGGTIYLRTGRRTSIANPEEPALSASVLATPDRFYATRILADSVDVVVIWDRAPGRAAALLRGLASRCPGVMTEVDENAASPAARNGLHFYRVRRDPPCLRQIAGASS